MKNITISGDTATLFIYGYIGESWWSDDDTTSSDIDISKDIKNLESLVKRLEVRINSYGGDVKHCYAIANSLRNSPLDVHTYNDGWACSSAAIIYLSAKKENRHFGDLALWMYHSVTSVAIGNKWDIEEEIEIINKLNSQLSEYINQETTSPVSWLESRSDTWLGIEDMITHGLLEQQEPYKIEDPEETLLKGAPDTDDVISPKTVQSFKNFKNSIKMNNEQNQGTPPTDPIAPIQDNNQNNHAPANTDDASDVTVDARLDAIEASLDTLRAENTTLQAAISAKDAEIADMKARLDGRPAMPPAAVPMPEPIQDTEEDTYEDPFTTLAQKGALQVFEY